MLIRPLLFESEPMAIRRPFRLPRKRSLSLFIQASMARTRRIPVPLTRTIKPERTDNFTFSIQRAIGTKMTLETGYIGRIIRNEEQEINIDAVPYMTTLNGQSFAQAYAATYLAMANVGISRR